MERSVGEVGIEHRPHDAHIARSDRPGRVEKRAGDLGGAQQTEVVADRDEAVEAARAGRREVLDGAVERVAEPAATTDLRALSIEDLGFANRFLAPRP